MDVAFSQSDPFVTGTDALILPISADNEGVIWGAFANSIDDALQHQLSAAAAAARFRGKVGSTFSLATLGAIPARRIMLTGIGAPDQMSEVGISKAIGAAVRACRDLGDQDVLVALPAAGAGLSASSLLQAGAVGALLSAYRFDRYRGTASKEITSAPNIASLTFHDSQLDDADASRALARAAAIADGVRLARDLVNEPASVLNPEHFAAVAQEVADATGLDIEVLGPEALAELGANAMLAVGGGSADGPRLIRLSYTPQAKQSDDRVVGLVGKAITFDTGGYSIKPYEGMLEMKGDMAGGAAVLGTMSALRALDCPVRVIGVICAAENMISGTAFRPGDVIEGMNGVTMEILSTDAEGRLVLADGLVDTARRGATEMIDLATLTGAAVVALGEGTSALFANDDDFADNVLRASDEAGERMWRMPLIDEFESKIKGDVADIKNTGGRGGGAITAALFLRHFCEGLPWVHLDIAGAARQDKASELGPKGSTGVGVRTLLRYLTTEA